ncbi:MAG: hypothetical protein LBR12_02510 [Opitutaceae bacterium]|jgi:hypothetical protein|nr:hypothetical protein [Opitutaceae bacterium]
MKIIEITLSVSAVTPLLDLLLNVAGELKTEPALPQDILRAPAKDLGDFWRDELLAAQTDDCGKFFALFTNDKFLSKGTIQITPENSDPVLRACAAMRLRLRATHPEALDERVLQATDKLPKDPALSRVLLAYVFLAELQNILLGNRTPHDPAPPSA